MKARIERALANWGRFSFRFRWSVLAAALGVFGVLAAQLPHLAIDTSTEGFLPKTDPMLLSYNDFRDQFGRDSQIMLAVEPREVFDLAFLRKLRELHEVLEAEVPKLDQVTSLINARSTRGEGDTLIVDDLLEELPSTPEEMEELRRQVLANPLYRDSLISRDGRVTAIIIETDAYSSFARDEIDIDAFAVETEIENERPPYLTGEENRAIVNAVRSVIARFHSPDFPIRSTGSPIIGDRLQVYLAHDMQVFLGLALLTIAGFLYVLFRRVAAVVLPLMVILASLLSTLGAMAATGVPISVPTQILPSFLAAVGVGYSVHLLVVFYQHFDRVGDKEAALAHALGHSGLAIFMTAITTVAGLLSFSTANLVPVAMFGTFAAVGVGMALLYTMVLLPALLAITPMRPAPERVDSPWALRIDRFLVRCGDFASGQPWKVTLCALAIAIVAGSGIADIRFSHIPIEWFPEEDPIRGDTDYIDLQFGGSSTFEVVIDTQRENGLHEPETLRRMALLEERVDEFVREGHRLGRTLSLLDILRETHQALNENDPASYAIPERRELIAQELLLFENAGSDDLEKVVDSQFRLGRFTVKNVRVDAFDNIGFVEEVESEFSRIMGEDIEITVTGLQLIMTTIMKQVIVELTRSYGLAFLLITPIMMLLIGSVRGGLISMVPNLTPIIMTLGLMGWLDIPIDIFTLLIGCIAIGLAVDDTIHFIHGFQRYYSESGDARLAVRQTMQTTGRALLFTSLVLSTGFFIFMNSSMSNLFNFGLLTGFAISVAFICDITVTPALLTLASRTRRPWNIAGVNRESGD